MQVRCGASSDDLTVWAAKVNLAYRADRRKRRGEDPDQALAVTRNANDDNGNTVEDRHESNRHAEPGGDGGERFGAGELDIQPRDLPAGTVTLSLPANDAFAAYRYNDKYDGRLPSTTWDAAEAPAGVFLEGVTTCTAQSMTLSYTVNNTTLSSDSGAGTVRGGGPGGWRRLSEVVQYPPDRTRRWHEPHDGVWHGER